MRLSLLFFISLNCSVTVAQPAEYTRWIGIADSLLTAGNAGAAAGAYGAAFASFGDKGYLEDRYAAARAWAQAGVPDSAFFHLNRLVEKAGFADVGRLEGERDFEDLRRDFRWTRLVAQIRMRREHEEALRNDPLVLELEEIHRLDQWYRVKRDSVLSVHPKGSEAYRTFHRNWLQQDSLNALRIAEILDAKGWLGPEEVGAYASKAFYLVVQHAPLAVQEKYLPVMRKAVSDGKASPADLAYLEDRVLMRNGKPQRYGSQITTDPETGAWILHPVEDPERLDERRASVGLGPIADYLERTGAVWKR